MTEFERQVTATLTDLLTEVRCPDGYPNPSNWERAAHLAPRMVAALVAFALSAAQGEAFGVPEQKALAALRGDS